MSDKDKCNNCHCNGRGWIDGAELFPGKGYDGQIFPCACSCHRVGQRKRVASPKSQTQTIARTFHLPTELDNRLRLLASELDITISKLIRKILSDFL